MLKAAFGILRERKIDDRRHRPIELAEQLVADDADDRPLGTPVEELEHDPLADRVAVRKVVARERPVDGHDSLARARVGRQERPPLEQRKSAGARSSPG